MVFFTKKLFPASQAVFGKKKMYQLGVEVWEKEAALGKPSVQTQIIIIIIVSVYIL